MRWPHRPDDGGPRWPWRAEFGGEQARGAPRGLTWRELAGTLVGRMAGQRQTGCRQAGSGRARSRARASLNWVFQGQCFGRCKVSWRAERVSRPAREKKRRRRVLVVTTCSSSPMRVVQRARLWAITCTASQAPLAAKRPEGRWFSPAPYSRSRMAFSISAWRRWSASSARVLPLPVGDAAVIAVGGKEGQLGTGRGLHPPDDEPHRCGVGLTLKGGSLGSVDISP